MSRISGIIPVLISLIRVVHHLHYDTPRCHYKSLMKCAFMAHRKPQSVSLYLFVSLFQCFFVVVVAPWFEQKGEQEVTRKTGDSVRLECSAKGFPLNVEWKFKGTEKFESCIGKI